VIQRRADCWVRSHESCEAVCPDKVIDRDAFDGGRPANALHLATHENRHVLLTPLLFRSLFSSGEFLLSFLSHAATRLEMLQHSGTITQVERGLHPLQRLSLCR
jgi:hypothetical protein